MELARDAAAVFNFDGRRAFVTGGESGIARATVLLLAALGADVAMASLGEGLDATAEEIRRYGRKVHTLQVDLTDPGACRRAVDESAHVLGGLDAVVNTAGGSYFSSTYDAWTPEEFDLVLSRNLRITFFVSQAAIPHLVAAGGGAIVNVSSSASLGPAPVVLPYGAAKAGVNNLTMALAHEVAPLGVRVNAVAPGATKAGRQWRDIVNSGQDPSEISAQVALGRRADVEEQAWPIVFLLSPAANYVTGITMPVHGGVSH